MVYLAELLVVMTDGLKIVRIHPRNVHRVHGHKRLDDDASLSLQESDSVACSMRRGAVLLKHKNSSWEAGTTRAYLAVASKQEICRDSSLCLFHFDTKSEQCDCKTSSVR